MQDIPMITSFKLFRDQLKTGDDPLISEDYQELHHALNKSQLTALRKHKDFQTYVGPRPLSSDKVLVRPGNHHNPSSSIHNLVIANASTGAKHKMEVAISTKGKIYNHTILKRGEGKAADEWKIIKHHSIDK